MIQNILSTGPDSSPAHAVARKLAAHDGLSPDLSVHTLPSAEDVFATVENSEGCVGVVPLDDATGTDPIIVLDQIAFNTVELLITGQAVHSETCSAYMQEGGGPVRRVLAVPRILSLFGEAILLDGMSGEVMPSYDDILRSLDPHTAAILPDTVAAQHGLRPMPGVLGHASTTLRTRCIVVSRELPRVTLSPNWMSLIIVTPPVDISGALASMAGAISRSDIDITLVRSRAIRDMGVMNRSVYIEFSGGLDDDASVSAIRYLREEGHRVKVLGSYSGVSVLDMGVVPDGPPMGPEDFLPPESSDVLA